MLNVYNYYDDAEALPMYKELSPALGLYDNPHAWDTSSRPILKPIEHLIAKQPIYACKYAKDVLQGRFPEGEPIIMKYPNAALSYAKYVIGGRWRDAEPYIAEDIFQAFEYATDVIHGRFKAAEPNIMTSPSQAFEYAKEVLAKDPEWCAIPGHENGRWPEAEPEIKRRGYIWEKYKQHFGIE